MLEAFLERIRSAESLPSLPSVAIQVLQLSKQPDASVDDLAAVIQNDPALAAKLLKVVNSALFGIPRQIGSLKQATGLLGLRRVKIMALSFSLVETMRHAEGEGFDFCAYWRRSISSAVAARLIAQAVAPAVTEEAFITGLLSDIGMVVAWRCVPDLYGSVLDARARDPRSAAEIEADILGFTHAKLGCELFKIWGLPADICEAAGAHHGEGSATLSPASRRLAAIAHSAAVIAELFCQGVPSDRLDRVKAQCCEETGITPAQLQGVLEGLDKHVRDTASTLSVHVGEICNYAQLQADATMHMAQLSMQAETDRAESDRKAEQARIEARRLHEEKAAILEIVSTDSLTKVANRAAFDKRLDEEVQHAREKGHAIGVIFMDVDHFKVFNDTYGHQAGDQVLSSVGACLGEVVKSIGFAARYGGEEFAVIVADEAAKTIRGMAEEIRRTIETRQVEHGGQRLHVTASFGAVCVNPAAEAVTPEHLVRQADQQLYRAKRNGRNRVEMIG